MQIGDAERRQLSMVIQYSDKAVKQLTKISRGDKKSASMILVKIEDYADNPQGNFDIKVLRGKFEELLRLRVGNYRIIFEVIEDVMYIYEVKHRKEAYE